MFKRIIVIIAVVLGVSVLVIFVDEVLGERSPFKGELSRTVDHLINGSPQSRAVDVEDAIQLFDDTCMLSTVFKVPPYSVDDLFAGAGLIKEDNAIFRHPDHPLHAYSFERNEGKGFECFVQFVSFEEVETVIRPAFDKFTQTRLQAPMMDNPNAFKFETQGQEHEDQADQDVAIIRSFASTDDIQYFVILRTDSHTLNHVLQFVVLPISELGE